MWNLIEGKIYENIDKIDRALFFLLAFSLPIAYIITTKLLPKPSAVEPSKLYDPHIDGFGWYLTDWNVENATSIKEIKDSIFHGYVKDLDGKTIKSVSIFQGYFPHGWQIPKEGQGEDTLAEEGIPKKLIVRAKRGNYNFNIDPEQTFAKKCWVTIGIDLRFAVKGKDYNLPTGQGGTSLVIGIPIFEVHRERYFGELKDEIQPIDRVVLCTQLLKWDGEEKLYHYSKVKAILGAEYQTLTIDLYDVIMEAEKEFGIQIDKQHHIQPFIETCGGEIEGWIDYVQLE